MSLGLDERTSQRKSDMHFSILPVEEQTPCQRKPSAAAISHMAVPIDNEIAKKALDPAETEREQRF